MIRLADESSTSWLSEGWGIPVNIVLTILVASALHFVGSRMITRAVKRWIKAGRSRESSLAETPEATVELQSMIMSQRREQRARAVGQLLRNFMLLVIWGTAILLILTTLGVNVAPLMASAGVVGVALGFGAQTLVKDYLSGFFLIVEDQYGVGDLVDVGPVVGTVEEVTLRVTRVRDMTGVVWYVRNGEILRVANQSQGWTVASAVIPVSYDADLELIRQIVLEVGNEMYNDPEVQPKMLGRPTFGGVDAVTGEAIFVRIAVKSRAAQQASLSRDMRERLKVAFDRHNVVVPVMSRPLSYGADGNPVPPTSPGTPPPAAAAR